MDPAYEAEILGGFASFIDQGLVYRSKKPVYWSIPCETALGAQAEIEYQDKRSTSIWVAFPVPEPAAKGLAPAHPLAVVIWTTTPWTLPGNLAVAFNPAYHYSLVMVEGGAYLVANPLLSTVAAHAAVVLTNARLFDQLRSGKQQWESTFDALATGVADTSGWHGVAIEDHLFALGGDAAVEPRLEATGVLAALAVALPVLGALVLERRDLAV